MVDLSQSHHMFSYLRTKTQFQKLLYVITLKTKHVLQNRSAFTTYTNIMQCKKDLWHLFKQTKWTKNINLILLEFEDDFTCYYFYRDCLKITTTHLAGHQWFKNPVSLYSNINTVLSNFKVLCFIFLSSFMN